MKNLLYILFILLAIQPLFAQADYLLPNEEVIYSFETEKGKLLTLAKDKKGRYIIYRFGTKDKVELEFSENKDEASWKKFTYSGYLRGGGTGNLGRDLNYLAFFNGNYKYVIYATYFAEESEKANVGIKVFDNMSNKLIADIKGKEFTRKENLTLFRDNELINQDEEGMLYD